MRVVAIIALCTLCVHVSYCFSIQQDPMQPQQFRNNYHVKTPHGTVYEIKAATKSVGNAEEKVGDRTEKAEKRVGEKIAKLKIKVLPTEMSLKSSVETRNHVSSTNHNKNSNHNSNHNGNSNNNNNSNSNKGGSGSSTNTGSYAAAVAQAMAKAKSSWGPYPYLQQPNSNYNMNMNRYGPANYNSGGRSMSGGGGDGGDGGMDQYHCCVHPALPCCHGGGGNMNQNVAPYNRVPFVSPPDPATYPWNHPPRPVLEGYEIGAAKKPVNLPPGHFLLPPVTKAEAYDATRYYKQKKYAGLHLDERLDISQQDLTMADAIADNAQATHEWVHDDLERECNSPLCSSETLGASRSTTEGVMAGHAWSDSQYTPYGFEDHVTPASKGEMDDMN